MSRGPGARRTSTGSLIAGTSRGSAAVPRLWPETDFRGLFDAEVFSSSVGLRKPDPRIYRLALDQLEVPAEEAVFVGDGANDELAGAERVGMTAVMLERPSEDQREEQPE